ncbi:MAG: sulfatase-like hydrolase/transferase [Elusimicrobia bacterium]|nr:sulfatase-like hydrolase/transferase [Elusimicrobiota bacterium]
MVIPKSRNAFLRIVPLALTALSFPLACTHPAYASVPPSPGAYAGYNVIILSLGNVGTQHMSLYGYARRTTPGLDAIADEFLVFQDAFSPASWTLPVAASVFTALYPYSHKIVHRLHENVLDPEIRTLPELFRDNGYRTAAFTGGLDYYKGFSTMRGFQETDSNPNFTRLGTSLRQAKDWLRRNRSRRFFLFVHGYDSHCPFSPPDSVRGTFSNPRAKGLTVDAARCVRGTWRPRRDRFETYYASRCPVFPRGDSCTNEAPQKVHLTEADLNQLQDLYDETILAGDAQAAGFISSLGKPLLDKTIVVIMAEHGEMFAKHGQFGRAGATRGTLYDDVVHVPLLMRLPGVRGRRVAGLVELTDVAPTLARLLGVRLPNRIAGKDLSPLVWGGTARHEYVYAGLPFMWQSAPFRVTSINESMRSREWKFIREVTYPQTAWRAALRRLLRMGPKPPKEMVELYRIDEDPEESRNLAAAKPDLVQRMRRDLAAWTAQAKAFNPRLPKTAPVPKQLLEDARKHGYW